MSEGMGDRNYTPVSGVVNCGGGAVFAARPLSPENEVRMSDQRNELDVAWAAGLFEGEGCWNVYTRPNGKRQILAGLAMTDQDVVERFCEVVGFGAIHRSHSAVHVARGDKPLFVWRIYEASKVRELVALFMPYMGDRRRAKALKVLDLGADIKEHVGRRTHCPKNHPLSGKNLVMEKRDGGAREIRRCRTCRRKESRDKMRARLGTKPENFRVPG